MQANGIFIIAEIGGAAGKRICEINEKYDPRLARYKAPHVTLAGSSGVGPVLASVTIAELWDKLAPITSSTAALSLRFGPPLRFMQTEIVVLPLDPHGPLRVFHDRIATSGLLFQRARFTFSPHCTLSLYPTLTRDAERELLAVRVREPAIIDRITVYQTLDPQPSRKLLELPLGAEVPQQIAMPDV
ncbi:MAG: 2'-5' RNA ligase family protein [Gemmatimonadaceae bacterium]|nr:2'-5' RNA ligase family protein [Gemmatimonadaceae bacterium]